MKFGQPTSHGLVSNGYERRYDSSMFRYIFVPGGFSARDYGIVAVCSLSLFVVVCGNHGKIHSDFSEILSVDSLWPN